LENWFCAQREPNEKRKKPVQSALKVKAVIRVDVKGIMFEILAQN
jgi:hypothetical protein